MLKRHRSCGFDRAEHPRRRAAPVLEPRRDRVTAEAGRWPPGSSVVHDAGPRGKAHGRRHRRDGGNTGFGTWNDIGFEAQRRCCIQIHITWNRGPLGGHADSGCLYQESGGIRGAIRGAVQEAGRLSVETHKFGKGGDRRSIKCSMIYDTVILWSPEVLPQLPRPPLQSPRRHWSDQPSLRPFQQSD